MNQNKGIKSAYMLKPGINIEGFALENKHDAPNSRHDGLLGTCTS